MESPARLGAEDLNEFHDELKQQYAEVAREVRGNVIHLIELWDKINEAEIVAPELREPVELMGNLFNEFFDDSDDKEAKEETE